MGKVLAIVGYGGAGKRSLVKAIMRVHPDACLVPSVTERARRPSDLDGHYDYLKKVIDFTLRVWAGYFVWHVDHKGVDGVQYRVGTSREAFAQIREKKEAVDIIMVTPQAVPTLANIMKAKGRAHDFIPVFVSAPGIKNHIRRLRERGASRATIARCLREAERWGEEAEKSGIPYHYVLNTGDVRDVAKKLLEELKLV